MSGVRAVFVDRDGVINDLVPDPVTGAGESPLRAADVSLLDGVGAALVALAQAGWMLIGVSNQPAAAKGTIELPQLQAVQERLLALLHDDAGVRFDEFRLCLHHPDGIVEGLRGRCACRKPAPGMLLDAASSLSVDLSASWMVGDTESDVIAGHAAGCGTILVAHPGSAHKRTASTSANHVVADLPAAADLILKPKG